MIIEQKDIDFLRVIANMVGDPNYADKFLSELLTRTTIFNHLIAAMVLQGDIKLEGLNSIIESITKLLEDKQNAEPKDGNGKH